MNQANRKALSALVSKLEELRMIIYSDNSIEIDGKKTAQIKFAAVNKIAESIADTRATSSMRDVIYGEVAMAYHLGIITMDERDKYLRAIKWGCNSL